MNQLDDMRYLVEAIDRKGFSAAAKRLGVSKQLVSRRISDLEARLGVQLLVRTTRKLALTDLGAEYLELARTIISAVDEGEQAVSSHSSAPRGLLRISAPVSFGTLYLSALVVDFLVLYPEVKIELDLNDRPVDLISEGYDMAVRIGILADSVLIARKLVNIGLVICASPDYLARNPIPTSIDHLKEHNCLLYGHERKVSWFLKIDGVLKSIPVTGIYKTNNGDLIREAALGGLGLAQLPDFFVDEPLRTGKLVTVLDEFAPQAGAAYIVHPPHRQRSGTVRALSDFLVHQFSMNKNRMGAGPPEQSARISAAGSPLLPGR